MPMFIQVGIDQNFSGSYTISLSMGGGAFTFEENFRMIANLSLYTLDELDCLIQSLLSLARIA